MKKKPAPHIRTQMNISLIYPNVLIGLAPMAFAAIYYHGIRAVFLLLLSILFSGFLDFLYVTMVRKEKYVWEGSSFVSGGVLALLLPPDTPIWILLIGVFFSIIVIKQCFGGLGSNLFNPAFAGKAILLMLFPHAMTAYSEPIVHRLQIESLFYGTLMSPVFQSFDMSNVSLLECLSGRYPGALGTTCALAVLIGGVYLVLVGIVRPHAPVAYVSAVVLMYFFLFYPFSGSADLLPQIVFQDGLLFAAIFATGDYSTTPVTGVGRVIFGAGAGILAVLLVRFSHPIFAVVFPILAMNLLTPVLDLMVRQKIFGEPRSKISDLRKKVLKGGPV